jgi:hypothetical protein
MTKAEIICKELNIDYSSILNIYPYGSHVYGTADENSDSDYIIVYKSMLPSGAFKDNAISSPDRMIQGTCYSRSGFIDAINNYQISALECLFIPEEMIVQKKMNFQMNKFNEKELAQKIIATASSSWYFAKLSYGDEDLDYARKNMFHALRILDFGLQLKENKKIVDYSSMNGIKSLIYNDDSFKPKHWNGMFVQLSNILKA